MKDKLSEDLEKAITAAIDVVSNCYMSWDEIDWVIALAEVLDLKLEGVNMRLHELKQEEEDR